ncbi:c-type cytochrome [Persephonella sp.]
MRKAVVVGLVSVFIGSVVHANETTDPVVTGKRLAKHCAWCHDTNREILAPSFKEIMKRYSEVPDARKILFKSIKEGSKGKWKKWSEKGLYMPPQKPYFSDDEINMIIDWLMTLK